MSKAQRQQVRVGGGPAVFVVDDVVHDAFGERHRAVRMGTGAVHRAEHPPLLGFSVRFEHPAATTAPSASTIAAVTFACAHRLIATLGGRVTPASVSHIESGVRARTDGALVDHDQHLRDHLGGAGDQIDDRLEAQIALRTDLIRGLAAELTDALVDRREQDLAAFGVRATLQVVHAVVTIDPRRGLRVLALTLQHRLPEVGAGVIDPVADRARNPAGVIRPANSTSPASSART